MFLEANRSRKSVPEDQPDQEVGSALPRHATVDVEDPARPLALTRSGFVRRWTRRSVAAERSVSVSISALASSPGSRPVDNSETVKQQSGIDQSSRSARCYATMPPRRSTSAFGVRAGGSIVHLSQNASACCYDNLSCRHQTRRPACVIALLACSLA